MTSENTTTLGPKQLTRLRRFISRTIQNTRRCVLNSLSTPHSHPIFVVGHPRSGTTAIAELLGRHTGLRTIAEVGWATRHIHDIFNNKLTLRTFLQMYSYEFSYPIIQTPGMTVILHRLKESFPNSRIVYIVRDPRDVICSVISLSNRTDSNDRAIHDPQFILFQNQWLGITTDNPIASLAHRWNYCLNEGDRTPDVLFLRYEDFCSNKHDFITQLAQLLSLVGKADISGETEKQFRGVGKIRGAARWKQMLSPSDVSTVESICKQGMQKHGYS